MESHTFPQVVKELGLKIEALYTSLIVSATGSIGTKIPYAATT
ncbi:19674_t:CDS:2 [Gigaspora rosea]|nr:19674_t:CDS:2 [Gigaspora rosea]